MRTVNNNGIGWNQMTDAKPEPKLVLSLRLEGFSKEELKTAIAKLKEVEAGRRDRVIFVDVGSDVDMTKAEAEALLKDLMPGIQLYPPAPVYAS
jgi:hypothetical protein